MIKKAARLSLRVLNRAAAAAFRATNALVKARDLWKKLTAPLLESVEVRIVVKTRSEAEEQLLVLERSPAFISGEVIEEEGQWVIHGWVDPTDAAKA